MPGMLYLVPTPIGNLQDISPRMRQALEDADFIGAEDTRVTLKLLNHLGIKKPLLSYYDHNRAEAGQKILARLLEGQTLCAGLRCRHTGHLRSRRGYGGTVCGARNPGLRDSRPLRCRYCALHVGASNRPVYF